MKPEKRIAELEGQVRKLTEIVEGLLDAHVDSPELRRYQRMRNREAAAPRALPGSTPGHVWLERLSAALGLCFLVLAARFFHESESIGDMQKLVAGLALSLALIGYGALFLRLRGVFSETVTGCGLAGLYLTVYAAPSLAAEPLRAFVSAWWLGLLALCLAAAVCTAIRARSFVIGGITLMLPYLTVLHDFEGGGQIALGLMLGLCPMLAVAVALLHAARGWTLLVGIAVLISHGIYDVYLLDAAGKSAVHISAALGGMTACWLLFSLSFAWSVIRYGYRGRIAALTAFVNSACYFILVRPLVQSEYPEYLWHFALAVAAVHGVLALMTERQGGKPNPMLQVFLLCTVLALIQTLSEALNGEWLALAHAGMCLLFVVLARLTGVVVLKAYAVLFTLLTVTGMLGIMRNDAPVFFWEGYAVPANWFAAFGVTALLVLASWFSEHFVRRRPRKERVTSGQHAFAGTWLDARGPALAILHATAIAFILLTMTIFEFGENTQLPFILGGGALLIGVLGLMLFTPPIEIASVLLLAAGHVCYHTFLWLPQPGFETQERFAALTAGFALVTYLGAHAWERYLRRLHLGGTDWEHHAIAAFPHLAATAVLATLLIRGLAPVQVPAALGLLGTGLLSVGALTRLNGIKASGVVAMALAAYYFQLGLYARGAPIVGAPEFPLFFCGFLILIAAAERLFVVLQHYESFPSRLEDALRSALGFLGTVLGVLGLQAWRPDEFLLHLLLGGLGLLVLGALFRERRYWWAALSIFGVMLYWAASHFPELSGRQQLLATGAFLLVGLSILQSRARRMNGGKDATSGESGSHG